jgi:DNA-binding NarL/FixJ family response regulator
MSTQVLLADDHVVLRQALKLLLEQEGFRVVAEASDGIEAVRLTRERRPDVAVLDVIMPNMNGLEAAREIKAVSPRTRTIVLTGFVDGAYVLEALRCGVRGYVLKTQGIDDVVRAIREVCAGALYLSPAVSSAVVDAYRDGTGLMPDPLTAREREVLQLVAEGKSTKEIASLLGMAFKTADSHRTRIMRKLTIHDTAGLVRYAIRRGLIQP